jgi:AraC family transcriptional regulator of adaptative response / DNA-3-methyladenine glycosylase II
LLAKQLLTDTPLPVTQVALASGFESLRRFNAAFAERYRFNPTQLRREGAAPARPPRCAWPTGRRYDVRPCWPSSRGVQLPGVEQVEGLTLRRTVAWPHRGQVLRAG